MPCIWANSKFLEIPYRNKKSQPKRLAFYQPPEITWREPVPQVPGLQQPEPLVPQALPVRQRPVLREPPVLQQGLPVREPVPEREPVPVLRRVPVQERGLLLLFYRKQTKEQPVRLRAGANFSSCTFPFTK